MTIDERLEKLTERHEALTQTVELISHDVRQLTSQMLTLEPLVRSMSEGIVGLTAIVRSHEQRLSDLEN